MTSAYLFAMLAVTPSESREVALIANPEFEPGRVAGHRARRLIDGGNPACTDPFLVMAEDWVAALIFPQRSALPLRRLLCVRHIQPAASPKALTSISRTIRRWTL